MSINLPEIKFGYATETEVFLKACLGNEDRLIGTVSEKINLETLIANLSLKFTQFEKQVDDLFVKIDSNENKGSFLQKLLHLIETLPKTDALGDFENLMARLKEKEIFLLDLISKNKTKNLALKQALILELEQIKTSTDWINTGEKIKELRNKWIRIGSVEKNLEEELDNIYKSNLDIFFANRNEFYKAKNEVTEHNITSLQNLIDKANALKDSNDFKKTSLAFKQLMADWKLVGNVPKTKKDELWNSFKTANDEFFNRMKSEITTKKKDFKTNFNDVSGLENIVVELKSMVELYNESNVAKVKDMMAGVKKIKLNYKENSTQVLMDQFRAHCDMIFEIDFLNRYLGRRYQGFLQKPKAEQNKLKIPVLKELIQKDQFQLENYEENFNNVVSKDPNSLINKELESNVKYQKRKLAAKETLLKQAISESKI